MRASTSLVIVALALTGCPDAGGSGNTDPGGDFGNFDGCYGGLVEVWQPNHGHMLLTPDFEQQVLYGLDESKPIVIGGRAGHTHTLDPHDPHLRDFLFGDTTTVTVETDVNSLHSHELTISLGKLIDCGDVYDGGTPFPGGSGG